MFELRLDSQVQAKFPGYTGLILYAAGLTNGPSDPATVRLLRETEAAKRAEFGENKPTAHPHIAAWREAYQQFGVKPSKYPCSVEALLSRVLKGQELPSINLVADLYNVISLKYVLPVGGEDWDKLTGDLHLTFATGSEPFDTFREGAEVIDHPQPGEVVWADTTGVTCRCWNWRQGLRTRLTDETVNAYFVLDSMRPFQVETLRAAGQELTAFLKKIAPACQVRQELLGAGATA
jgi:DNA/RNA-binding domain of Phe-tRNA-synthetase-like protein